MNASNQSISLQQAITMTALLRNNKPANLPLYETFQKDAIMQLLNTQGAKYLRVYYGMSPELQIHAILVAADEDEQDLLPLDINIQDKPVIVEDGIRCPPYCPATSPLTGN